MVEPKGVEGKDYGAGSGDVDGGYAGRERALVSQFLEGACREGHCRGRCFLLKGG